MTCADSARLTVVGAGPAGLAAAVEAAAGGLNTTLVDAEPDVGGQYWRRRAPTSTTDPGQGHALFAKLRERFRSLVADGGLTHLPGHHVWTVAADDRGCTVRALDRRQNETGAAAAEDDRRDDHV